MYLVLRAAVAINVTPPQVAVPRLKTDVSQIWREDVNMGITVGDIKRAVLGGGDVAAYAEFWQKSLGNPPVPCLATFSQPVALPESGALLEDRDAHFKQVIDRWLKVAERPPLSKLESEVTVLGLPPYGKNVGSYLSRALDELKPDIVAIDTTSLELSAAMLYAFSIPAAVGLPQNAEVMGKNLGLFYGGLTFYPGNTGETAIIRSWQEKLPLLPVGVPVKKPRYSDADFMMAFIDDNQADRELAQPAIFSAYRALDEALKDAFSLKDGIRRAQDIGNQFGRNTGSKMREVLVSEACYIASRTLDIISCLNSQGKRGRVLVLTDITRYLDVDYTLSLMMKGITDEIYVPPQKDALVSDMVLLGRGSAKLVEESQEYIPETTTTQQLFRTEFEKYLKSVGNELLPEAEADRLVSQVTARARLHPDIVRGTSVRGSIAMREVLDGLAQIKGGRSREAVHRAALIALPPRVTAREPGTEEEIISTIAKEVLYNIHFTEEGSIRTPDGTLKWLSPEDLMNALKNLKPIKENEMQGASHKRLPAAVVADPARSKEMMKLLESKKLLKKGSEGQYSLTRKAIERLLNELDEKLRAREITPEEYSRQKNRLMKMLKSITQPRFKMSARDLANTIMEIMDAQDKQWNSEVSFERLNVYYHIKANAELGEGNTDKRDYYGLKTLIDELDKQGLLAITEGVTNEFTLTGEALDLLLDYLISRDPKGRGLKGALEPGKSLVHERMNEVRRYTSGDVFRDISFRRTLKEVAKKKKELRRVSKDDFRVFLKQKRQLQSDIVLCMDVSGSMGFQHKLMYARLAASGLARAAIDNRDRVGIVAFNNTGQTTMPMTDRDKDAILDYIVRLSARGNTNIGDGIRCATDLLFADHSHNQKFIILITDGEPTAISQRIFNQLREVREKDLTEESALLETRKAAARGVKVSVVHIAGNSEASGKFIRAVARIGEGQVRRIASADDIRAIMC